MLLISVYVPDDFMTIYCQQIIYNDYKIKYIPLN